MNWVKFGFEVLLDIGMGSCLGFEILIDEWENGIYLFYLH